MSEPTTPTGKRLDELWRAGEVTLPDEDTIFAIEEEASAAVWDEVSGEHVHLFDPDSGSHCRDCWQEAAKAERERLREEWRNHSRFVVPDPIGLDDRLEVVTARVVDELLAEPEE